MTPPSEEVDINFADFKGLEIDHKLDYIFLSIQHCPIDTVKTVQEGLTERLRKLSIQVGVLYICIAGGALMGIIQLFG